MSSFQFIEISIVVKAFISRLDGTNTIHRFRGSFDYDQLHAVVNHLIGNNTTEDAVAAAIAGRTGAKNGFTMEYVDEDGDKVCISCGLEWNEALQQHAESAEASGKKEPIKIYVTEKIPPQLSSSASSFVVVSQPSSPPASILKKPDDGASSTSSVTVASPVQQVPPIPQISALSAQLAKRETDMLMQFAEKLKVESAATETAAPAGATKQDAIPIESDTEVDEDVCVEDGMGSAAGTPDADFEYFDEDGDVEILGVSDTGANVFLDIKPKFTKEMPKLADFKKAMDVADAVFRCKVEDELRNENTKVDFGAVISRSIDKAACQVEVSVNLKALYRQALVMSNTFLNAHHFQEGENLLLKVGALFPRDPIIDYNLACVACMMGNAERAIFSLETAVEHGYTDAATMASDPELALIKDDRRVTNLINRLNGFYAPVAYGTKPGKGLPVLAAGGCCAERVAEYFDAKDRYAPSGPLGNQANNPANTTTIGTVPPHQAANVASNVVGRPLGNVDQTHGNTIKQNVRTLEKMFPNLRQGEAKRLLKVHKNNVDDAVNILLMRV